MIPKIIHFSWLSGDPFPEDIACCLNSWKGTLGEYELWLWGKKPEDCLGLTVIEKTFDIDSVPWCKQAIEAKKYAFAADYIRMFAVYYYGGIYIDADVMMYKPFDDLLHLPYFLGEDMVHCFEPAIFGAEKGNFWVGDVLNWYCNRLFTNSDGSTGQRGLPVVFHEVLCSKYSFNLLQINTKKRSIIDYYKMGDAINIFPHKFFNSRNYFKPIKTKMSYCSHHFVGSWLGSSKEIRVTDRIKLIIPDFILNMIYAMIYHFVYSKSIKNIKIPYSK